MGKNLSIATILFTYNRPKHTESVLNALQNNMLQPEKLIIFQDGKGENTDNESWDAVNKLICGITWCDAETVVSPVNKGLAQTISQGITMVLETYDAVIVLEDDCVTHPLFIKYMTDALYKYRTCEQVWHVNGYAWDVDVVANGYDAFFCGRAGSWGWATWKDRWATYKEDYKILARIKHNPATKQQFDIWGRDLESYLYGNIKGTCNSWATFWAMAVIEHHGYCLIPYESLVNNIGFDGTGVHCGSQSAPAVHLMKKDRIEELKLPEEIEFPPKYEKVFRSIFSWTSREKKLEHYYNIVMNWMQLKSDSRSIGDFFDVRGIEKIAIWGTGKLCNLLIEELEGKIQIISLVESKPKIEFYRGIPVKKIENLDVDVQMLVVIPSYDMAEIVEMIENTGKDYKVIGLDDVIKNAL